MSVSIAPALVSLLLISALLPSRRNALSDKWRERISVRLSPLITWYSNLRASSAEKKAPEPNVLSNQQTSTFYVSTEGVELSANDMFEGSLDHRSPNSQNELLQYRPELQID